MKIEGMRRDGAGYSRRKGGGGLYSMILQYLMLNLLAGILLNADRKRMHVARIVHAIAFVIVLALLVVSHEGSLFTPLMRRILGEDLYRVLPEALNDPLTLGVSALTILKFLVPVLFAVIGLVALFCATEMICRSICAAARKSSGRRTAYSVAYQSPEVATKLYRMHCVMRC